VLNFQNSIVHSADGISIRFPRIIKERNDKTWETHTNLNQLLDLVKNTFGNSDVKNYVNRTKKNSIKHKIPTESKRKFSTYSIFYFPRYYSSIYNSYRIQQSHYIKSTPLHGVDLRLKISYSKFSINLLRLFIK